LQSPKREPYITDSDLLKELKISDPPAFLRLFPIHLYCNKGAAAIGNEHTPSVITLHFERASGEFDASHARVQDAYQHQFNFEIIHPIIRIQENDDFKAPQLAMAAQLKSKAKDGNTFDHSASFEAKWRWKGLRTLPNWLYFNKSDGSIHAHPHGSHRKPQSRPAQQDFLGQERWQGLARYLDEARADPHDEWDGIDYAFHSLIADCPKIYMSFFWDVGGPVSASTDQDTKYADDINGSEPPAYGMNLQVFGGTINYGPWMDRQRVKFQSIFFPANFVDAVPASKLRLGQSRVSTIFKLFLTIEDETVLRIPMREQSKDWKWKSKANPMYGKADEKDKIRARGRKKSMWGRHKDKGSAAPNARPFGWLDMKIFSNTTVNYNMDMYARATGYSNFLSVDVSGLEITSSVNHALLWRSHKLTIGGDLSNPLSWNSLRQWRFDVTCKDLDLFILRDHLFLLTDLISDWSTGPPSDYFTFVPYQYHLNIEFNQFKLYLNTNDANIINNPADLDDNNFIILFGKLLHGKVTIPLDRFRPSRNEIFFDVRGHDLGLELSMPPKNTLSANVALNHVAHLGGLTLVGSHAYYTETAPHLTDRLRFDIHGSKFCLILYGFLIRQLMKVKDNYFGEDLHFRTMDEFQGLQHVSLAVDKPEPTGQHHNKSNDLDVILCITATEASALLPSNLYSSDNGIRVDVPFANADLRFTNYYMDLMVNFSPISASVGSIPTSPTAFVDAPVGQTEIFIQSFEVSGHRLFGLPPTEPTYVCNWNFNLGPVSGECSSTLFENLVSGSQVFAFSIDDDENALPVASVVIPDATFLRLNTSNIHLWLHVDADAILLSTDPIVLSFNDLAGPTFSERLRLLVPNILLACVDGQSASRHRLPENERRKVKTHAYLKTALSLDMLKRKANFSQEKQRQQQHILESDMRTHRADFLLIDPPTNPSLHLNRNVELQPPAIIFPPLPIPLVKISVSDRSSLQSYVSSAPESEMSASHPFAIRRTSSKISNRSSASRSSLSLKSSISQRKTFQLQPTPLEDKTRAISRPLVDAAQRESRGLPPASIALSSPLDPPYFPLQQVEPDLSVFGVVHLSEFPPKGFQTEPVPPREEIVKQLDETSSYTSFFINTPPGISLYYTPKVIDTVFRLIDRLHSRSPEGILDALQISTMTEILDSHKRKVGKGRSIEICSTIPHIHVRMLNDVHTDVPSQWPNRQDQYDLCINEFRVMYRNKVAANLKPASASFALHTTLKSLDISARERNADLSAGNAAIEARINDILLWTADAEVTSVNLSNRNVWMSTTTSEVSYLVLLIRSSISLVEELSHNFTTMRSAWEERARLLAFNLTMLAANTQDPPFLTRPTYAIRTAPDHLRNDDSWKILSRFRSIYQSLSEEQQESLMQLFLERYPRCPVHAQDEVFSHWEEWRPWDIAHVRKSPIMRRIFQLQDDTSSILKENAKPFVLDLKLASLQLVIDPGLKQTSIDIELLALNIELQPPSSPSGLMLLDIDTMIQRHIVHISSRSISILVNWKIYELVDKIIDLAIEPLMGRKKSSAATKAETSIVESTNQVAQRQVQIVLASEIGKVTFSTVNITMTALVQNVNVSATHDQTPMPNSKQLTTLLVHSSLAGSQFSSRGKRLLQTELRDPSLFVSHRKVPSAFADAELMIAGASKVVAVEVAEEFLGIIEVVDAVLCNEAVEIYRLVQSIGKVQETGTALVPKNTSPDIGLPNLTVALFMDEYFIDITILPSLTYSLSGLMGRLSVSPSLGEQMKLGIDFDLDKHQHKFYSEVREDSDLLSQLEMPAVNGKLGLTRSSGRTDISVFTTVEMVTLDASALHSLFNVINRPEMSNVFKAIEEDLSVINDHIKENFPKTIRQGSNENVQKPTDEVVMLDVDITMAGVQVLAVASGPSGGKTAQLTFRIEGILFRLRNTSPEGLTPLPLPDIYVRLCRIMLELSMTERSSTVKCGDLMFGVTLHMSSETDTNATSKRVIKANSSAVDVNLYANIASAVVDIVNHMQDRLKDIDLEREKKYLRRLRQSKSQRSLPVTNTIGNTQNSSDPSSSALFSSFISVEILYIQISWIVGKSTPTYGNREHEDLVLSFKRICLSTQKEDSARLTIEDMLLQMVPQSMDKTQRSLNSALMPEIIFNVGYRSTKDDRKLAFHAAGKSLDIRLESKFILSAKTLEQSISLAAQRFRAASATWQMTPTSSGGERKNPFGNKKFSSVIADADFAGAVVLLQGQVNPSSAKLSVSARHERGSGRYGQFANDGNSTSTTLRAPGVAFKVQYTDGHNEPSLNGELKVDASSNILYPTVMPLILDISNSVKEVVQQDDPNKTKARADLKPPQRIIDEDLITADPSQILGRTRLSLGLRICRQEFTLSCQPIARVAATAKLDDIYMTVSSVKTVEHGHFFAVSANFEKLQAAVQHVYSRESTFSFDVDSIVLSVLNSKHLSGTSGLSAILKINPMKTQINARQLQDFLLFREIWIPPEARQIVQEPSQSQTIEPQDYLVQRYHEVASAAAFAWNASITIAELEASIDLGQAIGRSSLTISNVWASSKKSTNWEQNLCVGMEKIAISSAGRMSGLVQLSGVKVRTSIFWPVQSAGFKQTPLIQVSIGFDQLKAKAGFDYQVFGIADIAGFEFLMFNAREEEHRSRDRLVAILDGDKIQVICTSTSAAQGLALYQALERLIQENEVAFAQSVKEIERYLRRTSSVTPQRTPSTSQILQKKPASPVPTAISLHTDVIVSLRRIMVGAYPGTITDSQIFSLEASDIQARFEVALEEGRNIHSALSMTLGHLDVALASVSQPRTQKAISDITIEEAVAAAASSRGGTILRVPKVTAKMHTWQTSDSNKIEYEFSSTFEGKVDVGWNYSRIAFIRNMWGNHSRTLASRLGKPLPESAVKISAPRGPVSSTKDTSDNKADPKTAITDTETGVADKDKDRGRDREKITAVVNVPQSKYEYIARHPPIIDTPQLRDMGEATPPLEWIGLHRDRLPNVTHQIVIVTLLEVAKEVEDLYGKVLGSS
jgi:hypothetical protein